MAKSKSAPSIDQQLQSLRSYGVEAKSASGGRWSAQKGDCVAVLEQTSDGLRLTGEPGFQIGAEVGQLLDGGYQKFLLTPTRKLPATAEHLRQMHAFQEALAAALGEPALYNLSLGTVSTTYHYDRVKGRANP
jgi:hypothetical protein